MTTPPWCREKVMVCYYVNGKHVCIFSLLGWVTEKFYPENGNCSEGAGRTRCAAQLGIRVHCAASSTARVLKLWEYVLEEFIYI